MKPFSILFIVLGALGMLWGAFALVMAFSGYGPDTSYLGRESIMGYGITYTYDEEGNRSPSESEVAAVLAEQDAKSVRLVRTHKIRGGIMLGSGVLLLGAGIVLARKGTKKRA